MRKMTEMTTIQIKKTTMRKLWNYKSWENKSYTSVIEMLMCEYDKKKEKE